jgi:circadian clock protein KaiC
LTNDQVRNEQALIRSLSLNVPGLETVLGGGLPEYSFNLIAGGPGTGKTTLAQQIVFGAASVERPALYFTVLGEPTLKMLRYMRQFSFFDPGLVGSAVEFINLGAEAMRSDAAEVMGRIVEEVERAKPGIVVVDSFRSLTNDTRTNPITGIMPEHFVQGLGMRLTSWEVTSFLIGEYTKDDEPNPVFTVADGVLWLTQVTDRNSVVRKLQVLKIRGRAPMPGLHTYRITDHGLQIFPRIPEQKRDPTPQPDKRHSTGVPGLDEIMGGGIPVGDVVMIAGPAGSGKTTFATQFTAAAQQQDESVVVAVFEEYPEEYLARSQARASGLEQMVHNGKLKLIYLRPLDLSVDEAAAEILEAVTEIGASRVVIDSLSGFQIALAPAFREDFQESLYRLVGTLTATRVTVMLTAEVVGGYPVLAFAGEKVSFITDNVIAQRYVEIGGKLQKVLCVVKMRGSQHSHDFRTYEVGPAGAVVGGPLRDYHGITTGTPDLAVRPTPGRDPGLTDLEGRVLDALIGLGSASREALAVRTGLPPDDVATALERLVALRYAATLDDVREIFRAVAQ